MSGGYIWNPATGQFETINENGGYIWNPSTQQFENINDSSTSSDTSYAEYIWGLPQQDLPTPQKSAAACDHNWQTYVGLHESFEYCKLCDVKRSL